VITTVSRDEQAAQARLAGADVIINRKTENVIWRIRDVTGEPAGVDRIIEVDFGANHDVSVVVLAQNGVIASYASDAVRNPAIDYFAFAGKNATLRTVLIYEAPQSARDAAARDIVQLLETGYLKHQVAARLSLDHIVEAHEAMEGGRTIGKILLDVAA
jgi:NADPH:quinone reductase